MAVPCQSITPFKCRCNGQSSKPKKKASVGKKAKDPLPPPDPYAGLASRGELLASFLPGATGQKSYVSDQYGLLQAMLPPPPAADGLAAAAKKKKGRR